MAKRIGVLEADQALNAEPRSFVKKSVAKMLVRRLEAVQVSHFIIKMVKLSAATIRSTIKGYWDGPMGCGNVLPFSPPTDPLKKHHYEIPREGERGLWRRHFKKKIRVSARSRFSHQPLAVPATHINALALADALQG